MRQLSNALMIGFCSVLDYLQQNVTAKFIIQG